MISTNDLEKLIENLPFFIHDYLKNHSYKDQLIEIVLDVGRQPEARFVYGPEYLSQKLISWQDLDYLTKRISSFSTENRAGIERTLHRISCIRNRQYLITGLTCRVGRAIFGTISVIQDLLESGKSLLILGRPGVGKTTIIREIARILADEMEKRVIIIDTSNEIGGDGDIPHFGIGRARRLQVPKAELQHQVMIEAVENHMPQIIIIDEIGTELEVLAARTIAEKGVQLIGTTHGNCLDSLIKNPSLSDLIGGIQYVTLSDDEAKRRGTQKSILERKAYPAFEIVIEINSQNFWTIHEDVILSVDSLLNNIYNLEQVRHFDVSKILQIKCYQSQMYFNFFKKNSFNLTKELSIRKKSWFNINKSYIIKSVYINSKPLTIYSYSISKNFVRECLIKTGVKFILTDDVQQASFIVGLKKHFKQNFKLKELIKQKHIPIYSLNRLSLYEFVKMMNSIS